MSISDLSVLEKAFLILDALRPDGGPRSLSAVAHATGLPKSTVYRITRQLVQLGVLVSEPGGLALGHTLFELGAQVPEERGLRELALPFMQDVYEATHATVHLGIRDALDVLLVEKIRGHFSQSYAARVGGRLPLTCTAVGKALLAYSTRDDLDTVLGHPMRRLTEHSVLQPEKYRAELAAGRRVGVFVDRGEAQLGLSCLACPVARDGVTVAAIAVSAPTDALDVARLGPAVRTASLALSRQISSSRPRLQHR